VKKFRILHSVSQKSVRTKFIILFPAWKEQYIATDFTLEHFKGTKQLGEIDVAGKIIL
jgi:hypothetical protein